MNKYNGKLIATLSLSCILIIFGTFFSFITYCKEPSVQNQILDKETDKTNESPVMDKTSTEKENVGDKENNNSLPEDKIKSDNSNINNKSKKIKADNIILSMSESEKRNLNIFFSNFSEAFFWDYSRENKDDEHLVAFAFTHNLLNNSKEIIWEQDREGISGKTVNRTIDKYFGVTVPLKSIPNADVWIYEDNAFWKPASDGESFDYFSVVSDMDDMGDGTFQAKYDVFYAGYDELTEDCYSYTTAEASKKCEFIYSATAVIKPKIYNGKNTYELISLHKN